MIRVRGSSRARSVAPANAKATTRARGERDDVREWRRERVESDGRDDGDDGTHVHAVRVFARVEGNEKQAIATHGADGDGADGAFFSRAAACASACARACERATSSANAEEAFDLCAVACEDACARPDASGKFEITLRRGCEVARGYEEALIERARADKERERESGGKHGGGEGDE